MRLINGTGASLNWKLIFINVVRLSNGLFKNYENAEKVFQAAHVNSLSLIFYACAKKIRRNSRNSLVRAFNS